MITFNSRRGALALMCSFLLNCFFLGAKNSSYKLSGKFTPGIGNVKKKDLPNHDKMPPVSDITIDTKTTNTSTNPLGNYTIIVTPGSKCNEFCFTLQNQDNPGSPLPQGHFVKWYIDNIYYTTHPSVFCVTLPKSIARKIDAKIWGPIGTGPEGEILGIKDTIEVVQTATATCPCNLDQALSLEIKKIGCEVFSIKTVLANGYIGFSPYWTIDGKPAVGSFNQLITGTPTLKVGSHKVCALLIGGLDGEPDNLCCGKVCTTLVVPGVTELVEIIPYCPIKYPLGPWYNPCNNFCSEYELIKQDGSIGTSANGCISYLIDGPATLKCYDIVDGIKCLRATRLLVPQAMPINGLNSPDESYTACGSSFAYTIDCDPSHPNYEVWTTSNVFVTQGAVQPGPVIVNLTPGDYYIDCVNYETCSRVRRRVQIQQGVGVATSCDVYLPTCENLSQQLGGILSLKPECETCKEVVENATKLGPWIHTGQFPTPNCRVLQREYTDESTCNSCLVTFTVCDVDTSRNHISFAVNSSIEPCITINQNNLLECLRNKPLKMFSTFNPSVILDVNPSDGIEICCDNMTSQVKSYYIYDPENDCCFMTITIYCSPEGGVNHRPASTRKSEGVKVSNAPADVYKIYPNPTSNVFKIKSINSDETFEKVEIMDGEGRVLLSKQNVNQQTEFDMSKFARGAYLVKLKTKTQVVTLKLFTISEQ